MFRHRATNPRRSSSSNRSGVCERGDSVEASSAFSRLERYSFSVIKNMPKEPLAKCRNAKPAASRASAWWRLRSRYR